jgi:hypothetical protein
LLLLPIIETNPIEKAAASPRLKQISANRCHLPAIDFLDFAFSFTFLQKFSFRLLWRKTFIKSINRLAQILFSFLEKHLKSSNFKLFTDLARIIFAKCDFDLQNERRLATNYTNKEQK